MEEKDNQSGKKFGSVKEALPFINKDVIKFITGPLGKTTSDNFREQELFDPSGRARKALKEKFGITYPTAKERKALVNNGIAYPQEYLLKIAGTKVRNNPDCEYYRKRFNIFLENAVNRTLEYEDNYTTEAQYEKLERVWEVILLTQLCAFDLVFKSNTPGAPPKTHVYIFMKYLYIILRSLIINKKKSISRHEAIRAFLKGYLNIDKEDQTIRQDLHR